jgi:hypothetical protein
MDDGLEQDSLVPRKRRFATHNDLDSAITETLIPFQGSEYTPCIL